MNPTTVATRTQQGVAKKSPSLETIINSPAFQGKLAAYASLINPAIFVSVLTNQFRKNPKLKLCTQESVFDAIVTCAQLGILPNGRDAHLIPYKRNYKDENNKWQSTFDCQLQIDYKGLATLAWRNADLVEPLLAEVVCKNDMFKMNMGRVISHEWSLERERGDVIGAYAIAKFKTGGERHEILSRKEIDKARSVSKAKDDGPWVDWFEAMSKKTAAKRLCKWLDLAPETVSALETEDRMNTIEMHPAIVAAPAEFISDPDEPEQLEAGDPDPTDQPATTQETKATHKQEPKEAKPSTKQEPRKEPEQGGLLD